MHNKLKDLVFGLNEFEKTKIELRFKLMDDFISSLKIDKIEDFELIEECIYKIKELLRIKSSNLNKTLSNPANSLRKKDVSNILNKLDKIKYDFLKSAFSAIKTTQYIDNNFISDNIDNENLDDETPKFKENELFIFKNETYTLKLNNGKAPYLIVDFRSDVDYVLIRNLSTILFEIYNAHGTNILIESNKVLIVPRMTDDKLFELPRIKVDIEEIFEKLSKNLKKSDEENKDIKDNFIEIKEKPQIKKRTKDNDLSLDALLESNPKPDFTPKPNPKKDDNTVKIIVDEPIEIEKKEEEIKEPEIKIEHKKFKEQKEEKKKEVKTEENFFEVYRDDKIVAYFEKNSIAQGELRVEPINKLSMKKLNESDLSYMFIFSKVFSSLLFEIKEAHGTNLIMDYENGAMRIVPRYQEDNLPLKWNPKQESEEFLEQIKTRLIKRMQKEISDKKSQDVEKVEGEVISEEKPKEISSSKKEKAEHLLESLIRIP
jgi:diadenosine tetraphosphate (Ap4A) HIT family hydrolase